MTVGRLSCMLTYRVSKSSSAAMKTSPVTGSTPKPPAASNSVMTRYLEGAGMEVHMYVLMIICGHNWHIMGNIHTTACMWPQHVIYVHHM